MRPHSTDPYRAPHLARGTLLLTYLTAILFASVFSGHPGDANCWIRWTTHIQQHGLSSAYVGSGTDYPPVMQYILWGFGALMGDAQSVEKNYGYLRLFFYLADLAGLALVWHWCGRRVAFSALVVFSFLNIAAIYNTLIWGQVDGLLATGMFAALYLAWQRRLTPSAIVMSITLLFKVQAVVMVPVWGLLMLGGAAMQRRGWLRLATAATAMVVAGAVILLPFLQSAASRVALDAAIFGAVDRVPKVTMGSSNWWMLVAWPQRDASDAEAWIGGFTFKQGGLILFCVASAVAMWPLLRHTVSQLLGKERAPFSKSQLWLTAALVVVNFFFWATQMHERYSHPAMIFLLATALHTRDWIPYALFCAAYFLNLESILHVLRLPNYDTLLFDYRTASVLYAVLLVYLTAQLYGWRGGVTSPSPKEARNGVEPHMS